MQTSGQSSTSLTVESSLRADGTVPVGPASSKEAVAYHVLGEQKNYDCQDDCKQQAANSEPRWPAPCRARHGRISRHHSCVSATKESPIIPCYSIAIWEPQWHVAAIYNLAVGSSGSRFGFLHVPGHQLPSTVQLRSFAFEARVSAGTIDVRRFLHSLALGAAVLTRRCHA